jgi:hypothetical protein
MHLCESKRRSIRSRPLLALVILLGLATTVVESHAETRLLYGSEPVHPACVHALVMHPEDAVPITTSVSLEGCEASARAKSKVRYEGELAVFEDEALLGGGSFAYRELTQLENGIIGLAIQRIAPDGAERVSLAAVKIVSRPMMRKGRIIQLQMLELFGEIWVPAMQMLSFRSVGNLVHFTSGAGPHKVDRTVDFTPLGKLRD